MAYHKTIIVVMEIKGLTALEVIGRNSPGGHTHHPRLFGCEISTFKAL